MSLPAGAKQHKLIRVKEEVSQKPEFPPFVSRALSRFQETHGGGGGTMEVFFIFCTKMSGFFPPKK